MSDYFLNKIYDSLLFKKPVPKKSAPIVEKKETFKPLSEVYENITLQKIWENAETNLDILKLLSGVQGEALQKLYEIFDKIKNNEKFKTSVVIMQGSPKERAYDPYTQLNFNNLSNLIRKLIQTQFPDKAFIMTYAGKKRKLRLPPPVGVRVCEWEQITDAQVEMLYNDLQNNKFNPARAALKPLVMFALYELYTNNIILKERLPSGIGAELAQAEEFNKSLAGLPPVGILLPGDSQVIPNVLFNEANKIAGSGKADIALHNKQTGKDVFWISFKDASYIPGSTEAPKFQQWGSLKTLYYTNNGVRRIVDQFLTKAVQVDFIETIEPTLESIQKIVKSSKLIQVVKKLLNDNKLKKVYVMPEKAPGIYFDLFNKTSSIDTDELRELALKGIYGDNFSLTNKQEFGPENVNLVLQTPKPIQFIPQRNAEDEVMYMQMVLDSNSHIIKNPDLPNTASYLPCITTRFSGNFYFLFNNDSELLLETRLLVYPIGKVGKNAEEVII
jgi:hypothetical protein